jgi:ABC-2 type transport system permease protein
MVTGDEMRSVMNQARFGIALAGTNLKASFALRAAFWLQAVFMLLNNVTFFTMWLIFFHRFNQVGGWRLDDVAVIFGVVAAGYGLASVFAGGAGTLARAIVDGELDPLLVQPKSVLVQSIGSRSSASGWGDFATGVCFLGVTGRLGVSGLPVAVLAILASAVAFAAVAVIMHSMAFWLGRIETLARQLIDFTLTFSLYPRPLFGGSIRILLFTVLPAGFVGWLPSAAVRDPGVGTVATTLAASVGVLLFASFVFGRGIRRYESGNRFGMRF